MGSTLVKTDAIKYNEQVKASNAQISCLNKLKHQNKHLAYLVLRQSGDKLLGSNKVGSTGLQVKPMVNTTSLVGGGCMEPKWRCGTHWVGHKLPPKVVSEMGGLCTGHTFALQVLSKGTLVH